MKDAWKTLFMEIVDKHALLITNPISKKHSPWITYDLMRKIDNLQRFLTIFYIGPNLAGKLSLSNIDPEGYLQHTKIEFFLKAASVTTVCELLSQLDENKAMGLDGVPRIIGPSLTEIFKSC